MPRSFNRQRLKEPRFLVRVGLGSLLAANLIATLFAFNPFGDSAEDLRQREVQLTRQAQQAQARLAQTRAIVAKVERARAEGDQFLTQYTADRRSTFSTLYAELEQAARNAGLKQRPLSIEMEQVEGSDTLHQMTIQAAYEGPYSAVSKFVHLLDRSPRFLIIEQMTAAPQQAGDQLNVSFKLDTFVREAPGGTT